MSAKLYKAVAARQLIVARKAGVTGEVTIRFRNKDIKSIRLSSSNSVDVFKTRHDLKAEDVMTSNLVELIARNFITIL